MKIRILANSLRLRLKQPEVHQFAQTGNVTQVMEFGSEASDCFSYRLEKTSGLNLAVRYEANTITVQVPHALAEEWTNTERVGFGEKVDTGKGRTIDLLVEKDFRCLDGSDDNDTESYPNPLEKHPNC
jgi:hypothetical protein